MWLLEQNIAVHKIVMSLLLQVIHAYRESEYPVFIIHLPRNITEIWETRVGVNIFYGL